VTYVALPSGIFGLMDDPFFVTSADFRRGSMDSLVRVEGWERLEVAAGNGNKTLPDTRRKWMQTSRYSEAEFGRPMRLCFR
jgi:hypothetical protein